jgi:hypothetical protein
MPGPRMSKTYRVSYNTAHAQGATRAWDPAQRWDEAGGDGDRNDGRHWRVLGLPSLGSLALPVV